MKFYVTAKNQHGTHSPFVYNYVTKCLYKKEDYKAPKNINILLKSIGYFKVKNIGFVTNNSNLQNHISKEFPLITLNSNTTDLLYIHKLEKSTATSIIENKTLHNNSCVFINDIYKNKKFWKELIQLKEITVSINLFYCGVIFFRKEQEKEHFKIRL